MKMLKDHAEKSVLLETESELEYARETYSRFWDWRDEEPIFACQREGTVTKRIVTEMERWRKRKFILACTG